MAGIKYLLDTHIWLWSSLEPERLSRRVAKTIADPANELWLSPVSVWELVILCRKKRFSLKTDIPTWVANSISQLRLIEAPLTVEVPLAMSSLSFSHADPADQFLVASAKVFDLTLVTADERLISTPGIKILANRS
jgi:PIN domain nuclease of toxin-antitoxin system